MSTSIAVHVEDLPLWSNCFLVCTCNCLFVFNIIITGELVNTASKGRMVPGVSYIKEFTSKRVPQLSITAKLSGHFTSISALLYPFHIITKKDSMRSTLIQSPEKIQVIVATHP